MKERELKLQKIKVNYLDGAFWVVPSSWNLFNVHIRSTTIKKAHSIKQIVEQDQLVFGNYYFSFNSDREFKLFNLVQKESDLKIQLDQKNVQAILQEGAFLFPIQENVFFKLDRKGLGYIYDGYCFFVNQNYFDKLVAYHRQFAKSEQFIFTWHKSEFRLVEQNKA